MSVRSDRIPANRAGPKTARIGAAYADRATAVVLAGGLGTRLRASVPDRPKVLADVGGRPFVTHLLDQLAETGLRRAMLCTGHRAEEVETALGPVHGPLELLYSRESSPLGTAGALIKAMARVTTEHVAVLNGDSYCDVDLARFIGCCAGDRARAALVTVRVPDTSRFGRVCHDGTMVAAFEEKTGVREPGWINAGIYLFASDLVRSWSGTAPLSLESSVLPGLIGAGLRAFSTTAPFLDIGTPESYAGAVGFFRDLPVRNPRAGLLLLDRDGTVIREKHYLSDPAEVELLPGSAEGLRQLQDRGFELAMLTNQSGIGRGLFTERDLAAVNDRVTDLLTSAGVDLRGIWHCPHRPADGCPCRKPGTALFDIATRRLGYAPHECVVVGDKDCDVALGRRAGATAVLVRTGYGRETELRGDCEPDLVVDGLRELSRLERIP